MLTGTRVAAFRLAILVIVLSGSAPLFADGGFHFQKDDRGMVRPFKAAGLELLDWVREYSRLTGTMITVRGAMSRELSGTVTLYLRKPLSVERLTEVFHRVLNDNNYAVVDAPAGNGWVIERIRDARDASLPVYDSADVPDTSRYVTAVHSLKYASSEDVARMMRSFMPANSRIIPVAGSQVFITDTASNIRRLAAIISRMDTEEAANRQRSESNHGRSSRPASSCGEQRIEKLIVEKLEILDSGAGGNPISHSKGGRK